MFVKFFSSITLVTTLILTVSIQADESCQSPQLDENNLNLIIPCAGVDGVQYNASLTFIEGEQGELLWKLDQATPNADCQWNPKTCLTVDEQFNLVFPNITIGLDDYTAFLQKYPNEEGFYWQYDKHEPRQTRAYSVSHGTFAPYAPPQLIDGSGRKLLAIYMVGSDLEGKYGVATKDLKELIAGYQALVEKNVDVIVAFGGTKKTRKATVDGVVKIVEDSTWHGVKFANMDQIIEDSTDGRFGNADNYLYRDERVHLGDVSSLKHFLNYLREAYTNHEQSFLVFWNHGGSYKGIGFDQYYAMEPLSLEEVQQALNSTQSHFSLIGFDACLMASMETANYLYQHADYLLASEELEPGHGWNWTDVITQYARSATLVDTAKHVIDNYVKTETHGKRTSGKTLSVVDLSHFETVKSHTNHLLDELILHGREEINVIPSTQLATDESRNYGKTSVDLYDLAIHIIVTLPDETSIREKANNLLNELDKYIIHSRHDGTRPNSYGVTINKINNEPIKITLSPSVNALQRMWRSLVQNDTVPPSVTAQQNNVNVDDAKFCEDSIDTEYLDALKFFIKGTSLTEDQQRLLQPLPTNTGPLTAEQKIFLQQVYFILSDDTLSFKEKLADVGELENKPAAPYPNGTFSRAARDVSVSRDVSRRASRSTRNVKCTNRDVSRDVSRRNVNRGDRVDSSATLRATIPFLRGERAAFTYQSLRQRTRSKETSNPFSGLQGTIASFVDDHNAVKVTTIYGKVESDSETGEQFFKPVAELEAYPTQNGYFTPAWNRIWYNVNYEAGTTRDEWIPMVFELHYRQDGKTYTIYSVKIQYRNAEIDYPNVLDGENAETVCAEAGFIADTTNQCVEEGVLKIHVDDTNTVIFHEITPHTTHKNQAQTVILPEKASAYLKVGDQVRFLYEAISLIPGNPSKIKSTTEDDFITFTQAPEFDIELLVFADLDPNSESPIKRYYYAMRAKDSAGKSVITEPVIAPVEMPTCDKLTETHSGLNAGYQHISEGNKIANNFSDPIGADFSEAMATLVSVGETGIDPTFTTDFYQLFRMLYNNSTVGKSSHDDSRVWVWDEVRWDEIKTKLDVIVPAFEEIYQSQCLVVSRDVS
jgi:hypothetical protein